MRVVYFILVAICLSACSSTPSASFSSFYSNEIECQGLDHLNNPTYVVQVKENNKKLAEFKATKLALEHVLFVGDARDKKCGTAPLLAMANSKDNNKSYFDALFGKNKTYRKLATTVLIQQSKPFKIGGRKVSNFQYQVKVNTVSLNKKLKKDHLK